MNRKDVWASRIPLLPKDVPRGARVFVCVVVVQDCVIGHAPVNLIVDSSHIYCQEQVLCGVYIWGVISGGHSEAVQDVHGLRVASVVLVWGLWGEAESQAKQRVGFGTGECSLDVYGVNVGAEGRVIG